MNITEQKKLEEILSNIGNQEINLAIIGCGTCATTCKTGGVEQVNHLKTFLEQHSKKVVFTAVVPVECDERQAKKELKDISKGNIKVDAVLSMGCGNGNAVIADLLKVPVYPTNNSMFAGSMKRLGVFEEKCSKCGECITGRTAGICPITRCPKSLLNGPCGGSYAGKCEVHPQRPCAWIQIYEKLKDQGKLDYMYQYHKPKSFIKNNYKGFLH